MVPGNRSSKFSQNNCHQGCECAGTRAGGNVNKVGRNSMGRNVDQNGFQSNENISPNIGRQDLNNSKIESKFIFFSQSLGYFILVLFLVQTFFCISDFQGQILIPNISRKIESQHLFIFDIQNYKWNINFANVPNIVTVTVSPFHKSFKVFAENQFFLVEGQSNSGGSYLLDLPMQSLFKCYISINASKIFPELLLNVTKQDPKATTSFLQCNNQARRNHLYTCLFHNVMIANQNFTLFSDGLTMKDQLPLVYSYRRKLSFIIKPRKAISGISFHPEISVYSDLSGHDDFYHLQMDQTYVLFSFLYYNQILEKQKLLITTFTKMFGVQLQNFNFRRIIRIHLEPPVYLANLYIGFQILGYSNNFANNDAINQAWRHSLLNIANASHYRNPTKPKTIVLLNRKKGNYRGRSIINGDSLYASLVNKFPNYTVTYFPWPKNSFQDQIRLFAQTDIIIAPHGAQLFYITAMKENSLLIEIQSYWPPNSYIYTKLYQDIATSFNLKSMLFAVSLNSSIPSNFRMRDLIVNNYKKYSKDYSYLACLRDQDMFLNKIELENLMTALAHKLSEIDKN